MLRLIVLLVVVCSSCLFAGCDQATPTNSTSGLTPAAPMQEPYQAAPVMPGAPITPMTPAPMPSPSTPDAPGATGPTSITLEVAFAGLDRASKQLCELFDSIQDDASATAAAPQIAQAGRDVAAGMKQFKAAVAALSLAGRDEEINDFMEKVVERGQSPEGNLIEKLERVVNSPQYPLVRNEINGLLDGMLEAATSGDRRGLQHVIEQKKLRR